MATQPEVLKVWTILAAAYPNYVREIDGKTLQQTLRLYQQLLADVPADVLEATAMQHIAQSKFFPTVAELRQGANTLTLAALPERNGEQAWGLVIDTFTDGRYYQFDDHAYTPEFDDPLIVATLKAMGGYWHLYGCVRDAHGNMPSERARFVECYETLKRRRHEDALLLPQVRDLRDRLNGGSGSKPALTDGHERVNGIVGQLADKLAR